MTQYQVEMKYVSVRNWNVFVKDINGDIKAAERNVSKQQASKIRKEWTINLKNKGLLCR